MVGDTVLELDGDIEPALLRLRELTSDCPACILAAIRQSDILVSLTGYNFSEELKQFWDRVNEDYDHDY